MTDLRTILHVDMDAFYASVEQRDNPDLRGKPVVVGGDNRGVVAAASYEVRRFGVRSAMPMSEARRRCPDLIRIAPRMAHYKSVSTQIFDIFRQYTPLVEGLSLDEAFLDVSASRALHGAAENIALAIKQAIRKHTGLTASVGVADNKLVAKIASDLDKPDGLVIVSADNCRAILDPLPVSVIPGIGRQTLARLHAVGIRSIADLRLAPDLKLEPIFGRYTQRTRERAAGIDDRPVVAEREEKSISAEETFDADLVSGAIWNGRCSPGGNNGTSPAQVGPAGRHGPDQDSTGRFPDLHAAEEPAATGQQHRADLRHCPRSAADLAGRPIRVSACGLLGVGGSKLSPAEQGDLFAADGVATPDRVDEAVDRIQRALRHDRRRPRPNLAQALMG